MYTHHSGVQVSNGLVFFSLYIFSKRGISGWSGTGWRAHTYDVWLYQQGRKEKKYISRHNDQKVFKSEFLLQDLNSLGRAKVNHNQTLLYIKCRIHGIWISLSPPHPQPSLLSCLVKISEELERQHTILWAGINEFGVLKKDWRCFTSLVCWGIPPLKNPMCFHFSHSYHWHFPNWILSRHRWTSGCTIICVVSQTFQEHFSSPVEFSSMETHIRVLRTIFIMWHNFDYRCYSGYNKIS